MRSIDPAPTAGPIPGCPCAPTSLDDLEAAGFDPALLAPNLGGWER